MLHLLFDGVAASRRLHVTVFVVSDRRQTSFLSIMVLRSIDYNVACSAATRVACLALSYNCCFCSLLPVSRTFVSLFATHSQNCIENEMKHNNVRLCAYAACFCSAESICWLANLLRTCCAVHGMCSRFTPQAWQL